MLGQQTSKYIAAGIGEVVQKPTSLAIAAQLNGLGLRTPRGSQWYAGTVGKLCRT